MNKPSEYKSTNEEKGNLTLKNLNELGESSRLFFCSNILIIVSKHDTDHNTILYLAASDRNLLNYRRASWPDPFKYDEPISL
jgi:hypothetical protein